MRLDDERRVPLKETIWVAFDALMANKLRAFLTMLGVMIGSASIVLVVTVALTSRRFVLGQIESVGSNLVWCDYLPLTELGRSHAYEITLDDMEAVRRGIPDVVEVAGTNETDMPVVVDGVARNVRLVGVTEGFRTIRSLIVLRGRYFDANDMAAGSKVCLITEKLAARVLPGQDPVGRDLRLGEITFTVIGVFRERTATFGLSEIQDLSAIIPFNLVKYYVGSNYVRNFYAQADSPEAVPRVTREVERILRSRHGAGAVYEVQNLTAILDAAHRISIALTLVLLIIAAIALIISGIGIMNIMLVTVTERTHEIGIRKAIGAPNRDILYQFLTEGFLISGTGAVAGILIGVSIPVIIQPLLPGNLRVPISFLSVAVAFLVSSFTGVFFGYLPANKAARLEPVESLRYE